MSRTGRISDPEQLEALVSAVRQDIVDTLLSQTHMTVRELARHLGMRPSALYYHLDELLRVGLVSREERVRGDGRTEACFAADHDRLEIDYRRDDPANLEAVTRVVSSILRLADRDFGRGVTHPDARASGPARNLWGARGKAWLREEDLERANEILGELSTLFQRRPTEAEESTLCAVTWVLTPVADRSREAAELPA